MRRTLLPACTVLVLLACGSSESRNVFEPEGASGGPAATGPGSSGFVGQPAGENAQADDCQKMDIVFVVDNSGSMKEEQQNLASNFPKFVQTLDSFKTKSGAQLDWRVAVTTTGRDVKYNVQLPGAQPIPFDEKGDNGVFRSEAKCGSAKKWIDKSDPNAISTFACQALVGTGGPGIEMPLYATKLALDERMSDGTNAGFRRDDALLAVVIITDEDDCSREDDGFTTSGMDLCEGPSIRPVGLYTQALDTLAKGKGRWATAVIAGDQKCTSSFGDAAEAKRLKEFVSLAGKNGIFGSICGGDLASGLQAALANFDAACKSFPPVR